MADFSFRSLWDKSIVIMYSIIFITMLLYVSNIFIKEKLLGKIKDNMHNRILVSSKAEENLDPCSKINKHGGH